MSQKTASVAWAKNGSLWAVSGSIISVMSDSLIAFQPAIEEPSNMIPSAKASSSIMRASMVRCCSLPLGSVKRRSTYLMSLSLIIFRTSSAVLMSTPFRVVERMKGPRGPRAGLRRWRGEHSDGGVAGLAGADADRLLDGRHENLAVPDAPGLGRAADGLDGPIDHLVREDDLDLHLGQEIDHIFGPAIELRVALLSPEPFGFRDGYALQADFLQRLLNLIELEGLDDGFDFLHPVRAFGAEARDRRAVWFCRACAKPLAERRPGPPRAGIT